MVYWDGKVHKAFTGVLLRDYMDKNKQLPCCFAVNKGDFFSLSDLLLWSYFLVFDCNKTEFQTQSWWQKGLPIVGS